MKGILPINKQILFPMSRTYTNYNSPWLDYTGNGEKTKLSHAKISVQCETDEEGNLQWVEKISRKKSIYKKPKRLGYSQGCAKAILNMDNKPVGELIKFLQPYKISLKQMLNHNVKSYFEGHPVYSLFNTKHNFYICKDGLIHFLK